VVPTPTLARIAINGVAWVLGKNKFIRSKGLNSALVFSRAMDVGFQISGRVSRID
jgi:hypothetical protein